MYALIGTEAKQYTLNDKNDINKLPKVGVVGTGGLTEDDNKPALYGSKAIVTDSESTEVYILTPDNKWTKM